MEGLSLTEFTRKIYLKAPLETVYRCWATEEGLCSWFLRSAWFTDPSGRRRGPGEPAAAGDTYAWQWHHWDGTEAGTLLAANGTDLVEFGFAGDSRVRVQLLPHGAAILLTLRQYNIPPDPESTLQIHYGCSNGWTFWLANLKAWLEHGIHLGERDFDLGNDPMAGFEFVNM